MCIFFRSEKKVCGLNSQPCKLLGASKMCHLVETPEGVSETVPEQSLTIKQLYYRYVHGLPLDNVRHNGYYDENEDNLDNFRDDPLEGPETDLVDLWLAERSTVSILEKEDAKRKETALLQARQEQERAWREKYEQEQQATKQSTDDSFARQE